MVNIHFNQAEHLRIIRVEDFIAGKKYLMVHNREPGNTKYYPPSWSEVWATGSEFTSFHELESRHPGREWHKSTESLRNRWFLFFASDSGYVTYTCASDHGLTDSDPTAHKMNYILDLEALETQRITILREVFPNTDMTYERDTTYDDRYDDKVFGGNYHY